MEKRKERDLLEEIRNLCIAICKQDDIIVQINNELDTARVELDLKTISLTKRLIPDELQQYPFTVERLLDGQAIHEAGHILLTQPIRDLELGLFKEVKNRALLWFILNLGEDRRVNYYVKTRYRTDIGKRLEFMEEVVKNYQYIRY